MIRKEIRQESKKRIVFVLSKRLYNTMQGVSVAGSILVFISLATPLPSWLVCTGFVAWFSGLILYNYCEKES